MIHIFSIRYWYLLSFCLILTISDANAQCTSTGAGSWTLPARWTGCGGGIPISSSSVVINSTITLTLTANVTIASLTINNNQTLTVTGGFRLIITGNLTMNNQSTFLVSGGAFIDVGGDFNSANNGNVSVDGSGGGGSFLTRGCYRVGGGQPDPNIFGGTGLTWCVNGSCSSGNNSESGTNTCNTLLPVTLVNFSGRLIERAENWRENQKVAEISWATVNETNNDFYTLEKSQNGLLFEELMRVKGAGTVNVLKTYKEYDYTPFEGITYYRLRQTDYDGKYTYSKIIGLETATNLTMYPNSISAKERQLNIHIKEKFYTGLNVSILDINGKVIYDTYFTKEQGNVYHLVFPSEIPQGIYFAHLKTDNQLIVKKLLVL